MLPALNYEISLAKPEHLPHLTKIELSAATLFREFEPAQSVLGEYTSHDVLVEAQHEQRLWVALVGEAPIGFALVRMIAERHPHLAEMDVLPEYGRRGVGSALLRNVCAWVLEGGYDQITLTTFRAIKWNMPFYSRFGFVELPEAQQGPELRAIIEDERLRGLESSRRVVMALRR